MRLLRPFFIVGFGILMGPAGRAQQSVAASQEIAITARKYQFDPSVITVKQGQHLRLVVTAVDRDHGIRIDAFNINQHLKKGVSTTVELTPEKPGEYGFHCSVVCGMGHHRMKGSIVVTQN